jgi:hypothetical protein
MKESAHHAGCWLSFWLAFRLYHGNLVEIAFIIEHLTEIFVYKSNILKIKSR